MPIKFNILPYKSGLNGVRLLCENLPAQELSTENRHERSNQNFTISWGCGYTRSHIDANQPDAICNAVNKVRAYSLFTRNNIICPEYTISLDIAKTWLDEGYLVYQRSNMNTERGIGIEVIKPEKKDTLKAWNHYTKGFPFTREFRVNVAFGKVIEVAEKKRRNGTNPDPLMRSHADWVFCVYNLKPYSDIVRSKSVDAIEALGLDFGGVDVALNDRDDYCVFEVNTAPWIARESTTNAYINAFKERVSEL